MKRFILIPGLFITFSTGLLHAQYDPIKFIYGKYTIESAVDTANYCTNLIVYRGSLLIYSSECSDWIFEIKTYDFSGDGSKELVIEYYTGGAHCCFYMDICKIENDNFIVLDSLYLGNAGYEAKDLDNLQIMPSQGFQCLYTNSKIIS